MLLITSFNESKKFRKYESFKDARIYSVARWQPKGFTYAELPFLFARDVNGNKINLRGTPDPLNSYRRTLWEYYKSQWTDVIQWLNGLSNDEIDVICCWCPHASHSIRQMKQFNSFVCHTGLIGRLVNAFRPEITVMMDQEHHMYLTDSYKPMEYKVFVE